MKIECVSKFEQLFNRYEVLFCHIEGVSSHGSKFDSTPINAGKIELPHKKATYLNSINQKSIIPRTRVCVNAKGVQECNGGT